MLPCLWNLKGRYFLGKTRRSASLESRPEISQWTGWCWWRERVYFAPRRHCGRKRPLSLTYYTEMFDISAAALCVRAGEEGGGRLGSQHIFLPTMPSGASLFSPCLSPSPAVVCLLHCLSSCRRCKYSARSSFTRHLLLLRLCCFFPCFPRNRWHGRKKKKKKTLGEEESMALRWVFNAGS